MRQYTVRRLMSLLPVILGLSLVTFGLMGLVPGDPAEILAGHGGLDRPLPVRYALWLTRVLSGDLGTSLRSGASVWYELTARLPATLELAVSGLLIGLLIALPIGILAAVRQNSLMDQISRSLALLGASIPSFWLGAMLMLLFAVQLGWLPAMGRGDLRHFILPALSLGFGASAVLMRLIRASLLEIFDQDFIRTARAKGLRERTVVLLHAVKPSLLPIITVLGLQFGHLVGGAVIIETIFAWPGLGIFIIESILARDFPVIQGFALLMGLVFIMINFLVDMAYRMLDPRIDYTRQAAG